MRQNTASGPPQSDAAGIDAVGIDLGTTYSVVAHIGENGIPEAIADETGHNLMPSVISFAGSHHVVGAEAKEQARGDAEVASMFKRRMGDPDFRLSFGGDDYTATDLSAVVLATLKAQAERSLGRPVTRAVITVPAYFTHPQRTATIQAGEQAGLEVLKIISEPTAAALAYGLRPGGQHQRVLVYDLGGGTFDVSLVEITAEDLRVIGTSGDHQLGGRDWDDRLVLHLQHRFAQQFGIDLLDQDDGEMLQVRAETLKHTLSARQSAEIRLTANGQTDRFAVTRREFGELTHDLLQRTRQLSEQVLSAADLSWEQIDGVVPVGGSTRMPMVREAIERMSGKQPLAGAHPDLAVGLGAAIQAGLECASTAQQSSSERLMLPAPRALQDVIAHSLGMIAESSDRSRYVNSVLIPRNLPIPAIQRRPYEFRVQGDGDDVLEIFLTQGETGDPAECVYLGHYLVTGFQPSSGTAVVDVSYEYDHNGVVQVSAVQRASDTPLTVTVSEVPPDVPGRFLGRPAEPGGAEPCTVYLAFDLSGSMHGHPLRQAQRAAETFVSQCDLGTVGVGLIGFSDSVRRHQQATHSRKDIIAAITRLRAGETGFGNAGQPFDTIHDLLEQAPGRRYAVVLTDGVWYEQDHAVKQARRCHHDKIEIIAIGFGDADQRFLDRIASSSQQSFFTDLGSLTDTFSTIARELADSTGLRVGKQSR